MPTTSTLALVPTVPPRGAGRLNSVKAVRLELARLYWQARNNEVDVADASKLAFMLAQLAKLIEGSDLEERLATLEDELSMKK